MFYTCDLCNMIQNKFKYPFSKETLSDKNLTFKTVKTAEDIIETIGNVEGISKIKLRSNTKHI